MTCTLQATTSDETMKLKTRSVTFAAVALAVLLTVSLATGLLVWQIAKRPSSASVTAAGDAPVSSVSGAVTPAQAPSIQATPLDDAAKVKATTASAADAGPVSDGASAARPARPKFHILDSPPAGPPILPNEINAAVGKSLGRQNGWQRLFYVEPLARRFVASVDGLGRKIAPTDLWLLRPAPGEMKLVQSSKQPETRLIKRANDRRYSAFVQWFIHTDSRQLLSLYTRLYPLLQQTYIDLGHPDGEFNTRLIEVIDSLLATPVATPPLRVQPLNAASPQADRSSSAAKRHPRYEFSDARLESLLVGQKAMLRVGPQNAALLKQKLKLLRSGLIALGRMPQQG